MRRSEAKALKAHLEAIIRELDLMGVEPDEAAIPREVVREVVQQEPQYFTPREAQRILKIGESTFYQWIREGLLPQGRYYGHKVRRWTRAELEKAARTQ